MDRKADIGTKSFGALLRGSRGRAGLTQEELAARAGLYAQQISQLERDVVRRPHSRTIEYLAEALKLDAQDREAFAAAARGEPPSSAGSPVGSSGRVLPSPVTPADAEAYLTSMPTDVLPDRGALPTGSRMPLASNPLFVGRGDELLQVAAALRSADTTVALGQVVASTGLGGLGKTQIAVEFVHRYGRYFAGGVFWLSFASADEIPLQVAACAEPGLEARPLEERVQRVRDAWQGTVPRLLVFDNCEEEALLDAWRPVSGGCRVLVTSRRSHWSPTLGVRALPLDILPRADSVELLRRYRPDLATDDPGLDAIAHELGDLPLALHLAGSYLRAYRAELCQHNYMAELRRSDVLRHASLLGAGLDDSVSPTHHVQGVAQTFALSLRRLDREREVDRVAVALLARMACMAPGEPVPRDLLVSTLEDVDPILRADGMRRLGAAGLVQEGDGWFRLHRLVAQFVRQEDLDPDAQRAVDEVLIQCGQAAGCGHLAGAALSAIIPHIVETAARDLGDELRLAQLADAGGFALQRAGDLRGARIWFERAVAIRDRALGPDHLDTAQSLSNLGQVLVYQGEPAAAHPLFERTLAIRENVLGHDHPTTAQVLNDLAVVSWEQGDLRAARHLHERALAIRERTVGSDHADTANSLNNLALLRRDQGHLTAAQAMFERALAIRERVLGPNHPDTATVLNNLAQLLHERGDPAAARPLHERALAIREQVLGPGHPHVAISLNNLARLHQHEGDLAGAEPLYARALSISEHALGPEHRRTAAILDDMAALLLELGELDRAHPLLERVLAIRERDLGPHHPDTASSLHHLAGLLRVRGDPAAARPLFEHALAIRERVLGPDHPSTAATRRGLEEMAAEGDGAGTPYEPADGASGHNDPDPAGQFATGRSLPNDRTP
jgi:tetratricopeptide (TPR) repeat protein/DNA-binding XRE family transcriptional regulator